MWRQKILLRGSACKLQLLVLFCFMLCWANKIKCIYPYTQPCCVDWVQALAACLGEQQGWVTRRSTWIRGQPSISFLIWRRRTKAMDQWIGCYTRWSSVHGRTVPQLDGCAVCWTRRRPEHTIWDIVVNLWIPAAARNPDDMMSQATFHWNTFIGSSCMWLSLD